MTTSILEPTIEILKELPESFSQSDKVNIILQLQGMVAAGYSQDGLEGFEGINFPNIEKFMGGKYDSTGGQSIHTGEKTYFEAKHGQPTIMFAMQLEKNASDNVILARHNNPNELDSSDAVVAYLPFKIFKEAGIDEKLIDENGLLPKEIAVAHRETLFPLIAKYINEFLSKNIKNSENVSIFPEKHVIIDGNYADAIQTAIDLQELLSANKHQGKIVTIGTFHTHGINKFVDNAVSLLGPEHKFVNDLRDLQINGVNLEDITIIKEKINDIHNRASDFVNSPLGLFATSPLDANSTKEMKKYTKFATEILGKDDLFVLYLENLQQQGLGIDNIEEMAGIGLKPLVKKYSFIDRLIIEAEAVKKLDIIMSVDKSMYYKLADWTKDDNDTHVELALNGYNDNVYNKEVLKDKTQAEINDLVRPLLEQAYRLDPNVAIEITDEQLAGTNFITACRPESRKNSDGAIKAFVEWKKLNPDDHDNLILIGHAPENVEISSDQKQIIELIKEIAIDNPEIASHILLLPSMRSDAISTIMSLERACGGAWSKQEPWGLDAVTAMAKGIPLAASSLYASAIHAKKFFTNSEDTDSIVVFQSPSEKGATSKSSQQSCVDAMNEVSHNYDNKYKPNAQNLADIIPDKLSWESMVKTYETIANRILQQKIQKSHSYDLQESPPTGGLTSFHHSPFQSQFNDIGI
jgi:hypothetical protein